jgi:hypothetical protein
MALFTQALGSFSQSVNRPKVIFLLINTPLSEHTILLIDTKIT